MSSLRKLRRSIAHANMEREEIRRVNGRKRLPRKAVQSFFAEHWREYADKLPLEVLKRAAAHLKEADKKKTLRAKRRGGEGKEERKE
ncbi:hypothetical protein SDC9_88562 [bioreactor metagenome]|uniref:Uncharacterized protein n=1 Tax=bioreactor metagenome TaxID=1076179 RepID=A0A644ZM49_9ZZZZ